MINFSNFNYFYGNILKIFTGRLSALSAETGENKSFEKKVQYI